MRKILGVTLATLATLMAIVPVVMPASQHVTGTVTVASFCSIAVSPDVSFGSLGPTATSADVTTTVSQPESGNSLDIGAMISGSGWTGGTSPHAMPVGQTHWALSTITTYGTGDNVLTGTPVPIGATIGLSGSEVVHFMLKIPGQQLADTYTQTITFTAC